MITFIRCFSLCNIRKKLILLYGLNVSDILLTLLLINSTDMFFEANPVMAGIVTHSIPALALKMVLPAGLLIVLFMHMKTGTDIQLKHSNVLLSALLILYIAINILHIVWLTLAVGTNAIPL